MNEITVIGLDLAKAVFRSKAWMPREYGSQETTINPAIKYPTMIQSMVRTVLKATIKRLAPAGRIKSGSLVFPGIHKSLIYNNI
ncbi:MAG: hypothetical protein IPK63_15795 [Candidatus Competibacteraceae bacterium]|nr:hypothetical protein [Candidatus Competibacteraceae bacterium]